MRIKIGQVEIVYHRQFKLPVVYKPTPYGSRELVFKVSAPSLEEAKAKLCGALRRHKITLADPRTGAAREVFTYYVSPLWGRM